MCRTWIRWAAGLLGGMVFVIASSDENIAWRICVNLSWYKYYYNWHMLYIPELAGEENTLTIILWEVQKMALAITASTRRRAAIAPENS